MLADTNLVFKNYNHLVSQLDKFKSYTDDIEQVSYKEAMQLIVDTKANISELSTLANKNLERIRQRTRLYDGNFRELYVYFKSQNNKNDLDTIYGDIEVQSGDKS